MQPVFSKFRKIFSSGESKYAKYPRLASRIRKKRAATAARNFCRSRSRPRPAPLYSPDGYPPDKCQNSTPEKPRYCQAQTSCLPRLSTSGAAAAESRTTLPAQHPARRHRQNIRQPPAAVSTEQTAHPAAALTGFFIAQGGYRPLHSHLTAIN